MLMAEIATIAGERDAARQQVAELGKQNDDLRQRLAHAQARPDSRADLMRFVAVVLSSARGDSFNPTTHEDVCKEVAGMVGQGVSHAAIGEALASMLAIGAVEHSFRGFSLAYDWKKRMVAAGVPVAFPPATEKNPISR
jgi:hypothetical protein